MQKPERIREPFGQKPCHRAALLVRKAGVLPIGFRIRQVNLFMRHIEVAAEHDRFLLVEFFQEIQKRRFPLHAIR